MKRVLCNIIVLSTIILHCLTVATVRASNLGIVICEFSPQSSTAAGEEYVVLCNNNAAEIDITGWRLEYSAGSNGTTWTKKAELTGVIAAGDEYVLATAGYMTERSPSAEFSSGLALSAGHLRLTRPEAETHVEEDRVGWGSAVAPETVATAAPLAGQFLIRVLTDENILQDTDNNSVDFHEPLYIAGQEPPEPDPEPEPEPTPAEAITDSVVEQSSEETLSKELPIELSELLIDPVSPATDADDEFVELFNPTNEAVDLDGYQLQAGTNYSYKQPLDDLSIPPRSYLTLYARDSNLTLSNSGSRVRLLGPTKNVLAELTYEKAQAGAAFAWFADSGWQWTTTATPDKANILTHAMTKETAKTTAAKKKTSRAKTSTKSAAKAKTATGQTSDAQPYEDPVAEAAQTPVHPAVLAGVGGGAVLYGLYEYRQDVGNRLWQLRRYARRWRASR